ncbi:LOG family protein [Candidatus Woesearchaeota archaeon]|nr:LOG family protein [Candidatus Woesearchaeota archaeon]
MKIKEKIEIRPNGIWSLVYEEDSLVEENRLDLETAISMGQEKIENMSKEQLLNLYKPKRKLQIGVMGSAADTKYSSKIEQIAEQLGEEVAKRDAILFFGAEKDYDSLSTAACRGAKKYGGMTVGVTYGKGKNIYEKSADVIITSMAERGGPRESVLVGSCDAIIGVSGGSGTLTEFVIAYQANIPMIAMTGTGGWSERIADQYIDARKRRKVIAAKTPEKAVKIAEQEAIIYINIIEQKM